MWWSTGLNHFSCERYSQFEKPVVVSIFANDASSQSTTLKMSSSMEQADYNKWMEEKEKRSFMNRFPSEDESCSHELVKEYNRVDAPAAFQNCKDAIYLIIGDERTKALRAQSFNSTDQFLSAIKQPADRIVRELGEESIYYKNICSTIVDTYLSALIRVVWSDQTISTLEEARRKAEQLYTYYPISETNRKRISQTILEFEKIESQINAEAERAKREGQAQEKASRLSERIKNFALTHWSVPGGDKRYTSPGLALLATMVLWFGSIVSLFERIGNLFKKKSDA